MRIVEIMEFETMAFDKVFWVNGNEELCHATGRVVQFEYDTVWYKEYVDSNGEYHYC